MIPGRMVFGRLASECSMEAAYASIWEWLVSDSSHMQLSRLVSVFMAFSTMDVAYPEWLLGL
jgi:hypothetical protein